MITFEARPKALEVDLLRTAVVVIDMQNDFGSPGGMFERAGVDISGIAAAADTTRPVLRAARDAGVPVVYLKMQHAPDLADAGPVDGPHWIKHLPFAVGEAVVAPDGSASRILVRDTWNTEILDAVAPEPGDLIVSKHRYSGFFETELNEALRSRGTTSVQDYRGPTTRRRCSSSRPSSAGSPTPVPPATRLRGKPSSSDTQHC